MKTRVSTIYVFLVAVVLGLGSQSLRGRNITTMAYYCPGWGVPCSADPSGKQKEKLMYGPDEISVAIEL